MQVGKCTSTSKIPIDIFNPYDTDMKSYYLYYVIKTNTSYNNFFFRFKI